MTETTTNTNELATVTSTAASVAENFDEFELGVRRMLGLEDASDGELRLFHHICQRSGLDPFTKDVYMIGRNTEVEVWEDSPDTGQRRKVKRWITKYTIQVSIKGFRSRAREICAATGARYEVGEPLWCGDDAQWSDVWVSAKPPVAAKFTVFRDGQPYSFVAHYEEFRQNARDGEPNAMWKKMPANQLRKCAEVGALQMAFPDQLGGLVFDDAVQHNIIDNTGRTMRREPERARGVAALAQRVAEPEPPQTVKRMVGRQVVEESIPELTEAGRQKWLNRMFALLNEGDCTDRDDQLIALTYLAGRTSIDMLGWPDQLTDAELRDVVNGMNAANKEGKLKAVITDLLNTYTINAETGTAATTPEDQL